MTPKQSRTVAGIDLDLAMKIGAALIGAAMWLGILEYRVRQLEKHEDYYHGNFAKGQGE